MNTVLILVIVVLLILVVVSLVRGIIAFMQTTKAELDRDPESGATEMQLRQNKMMFARIKYQAMAVVVVALLLAFAR